MRLKVIRAFYGDEKGVKAGDIINVSDARGRQLIQRKLAVHIADTDTYTAMVDPVTFTDDKLTLQVAGPANLTEPASASAAHEPEKFVEGAADIAMLEPVIDLNAITDTTVAEPEKLIEALAVTTVEDPANITNVGADDVVAEPSQKADPATENKQAKQPDNKAALANNAKAK